MFLLSWVKSFLTSFPLVQEHANIERTCVAQEKLNYFPHFADAKLPLLVGKPVDRNAEMCLIANSEVAPFFPSDFFAGIPDGIIVYVLLFLIFLLLFFQERVPRQETT